MLPGPLSASPGWDRITDTGIRMSLVGDLALCTTQGFEILGLTCQFCKGISAVIRPWSKCGSCGAFLTRITESHRSPSVLRVDWDTGATTIYEEKPVTAVDFRTITAKQLSRIHARARGRAFQHLGEVTHAPGGLSSAGTGETSGMGSDVSSGGDDSLSAFGVTGTAARVPSAVSEQKEGETTGESGGWEYVREALPKANKGVYVKAGLQKLSHNRNLHKDLKLQVDQQEVELPNIEGLIFLNIPSWGSGADLWGSDNDNRYGKPRIDDGIKVEYPDPMWY